MAVYYPNDAGQICFNCGGHLIPQMVIVDGERITEYAEYEQIRNGAAVQEDRHTDDSGMAELGRGVDGTGPTRDRSAG